MASIWTRAVVAGLLWVGCGGDDDGADATDSGASDAASGGDAAGEADASGGACTGATVTGTVAGEMVDPVVSAWSQVSPDFPYATVLVMDEDTSGCDLEGTGTGEHLVIFFCDPPVAGEYEVVAAEDFPEEACPGDLVASANVEDEDGGDLDSVESGTVTIDGVDDCVTGTFDLSFASGDLSGDFSAVACE